MEEKEEAVHISGCGCVCAALLQPPWKPRLACPLAPFIEALSRPAFLLAEVGFVTKENTLRGRRLIRDTHTSSLHPPPPKKPSSHLFLLSSLLA